MHFLHNDHDAQVLMCNSWFCCCSGEILGSHRLLGLVVCRAVVKMHERSSENDHFDGILAFQIRLTEEPNCFQEASLPTTR